MVWYVHVLGRGLHTHLSSGSFSTPAALCRSIRRRLLLCTFYWRVIVRVKHLIRTSADWAPVVICIKKDKEWSGVPTSAQTGWKDPWPPACVARARMHAARCTPEP